MKKQGLRRHIIFSFFTVIVVVAVLFAVLAYYVIERNIINRAQREVLNAIEAANTVYRDRLEQIERGLLVIDGPEDFNKIKSLIDLDYIYEVTLEEKDNLRSNIALKALDGVAIGGARVVFSDEIIDISPKIFEKIKIDIKDTLKARKSDKEVLESALALEYAIPLTDNEGQVWGVRYAGKFINKDFSLVDHIWDLVFENELYQGKPTGTVTIFEDDVRVSTNVLDKDGKRAIGTRVSEKVYDRVVNQGLPWRNRAFVVTDWYLTSYEPIKDINGNVIGILYVGILEKPYVDLKVRLFLYLLFIIIISSILSIFISYFIAINITKQVTHFVEATAKVSRGELSYRVEEDSEVHSLNEFNELKAAFNQMVETVHEREESLKDAKSRAEILNKQYLDLVGFVTHELKGILSSIVLNTYSLEKGILGPITDSQRKTLKSISRNLDYLTATVKNFLNLSRIDKGEMKLNLRKFLFKETLLKDALEAFSQLAVEKGIDIENNVIPQLELNADPDLLQIVVNNLLSNAVKYGSEKGKIIINSKKIDDFVEFEFYNDGKPIPEVDKDKLFKKFSRLHYEDIPKVKGSGIGLYITKEIIERHEGKIWFEARKSGNSFIFKLKLWKNNE
jgi:two-component system NtrC family sensor kinase